MFPCITLGRFFTGLYTAILPPAITVLIQDWFLDTELCRMNAVGRRFWLMSYNLTPLLHCVKQCCGSGSGFGSGGSVMNTYASGIWIRVHKFWITDAYPVPDPDPYYLSKILRNFKRKGKYFQIFNDLLLTWQIIFFMRRKNVQVGSWSGRIRNSLASWLLIRNSGLQLHGSGSGSERNIFISATLASIKKSFFVEVED